jgi:hypothetical protein
MRFKKSKDVLARARGENPRLTVADNKLIVCNVRAQARKGLRFCAFIAADLAGRRVDISSIPNQSLRPVSLQSPVESRDRDQWQAGPTGEPKCETVVLRRLRGREGRGMIHGVSFDQMIFWFEDHNAWPEIEKTVRADRERKEHQRRVRDRERKRK